MSVRSLSNWLPVYTRQGLSLLLVVMLLAGSFILLLAWSNERYHQEVTQQLHKDLAQYVVDHAPNPIFKDSGEVDAGVLKAIAINTMMINPSVEVYLLNPNGKVLGHALPDLDDSLSDISIEPVQRYLNQSLSGPVFGTNPRDPGSLGIFSVAPLTSQDETPELGRGELQGYLYIMLASQARNSLADRLAQSYILKVALAGVVGLSVVLVAFMVLGFRHFSKPIRELARQMRDYRSRHDDAEAERSYGNEVEELKASFAYLQDRVQEQFDQLAQNDALRRELVSNISHDLRTPLAAMQGYIETLMLKKDSLSNTEVEHFLNVAHRHSLKLATLISQLFELSKLDTGGMAAKFERFSISELLSDICMEHQILAEQKGLRLSIKSPSQSLYVQADIALIGRVIQNLLDNAIQHTDAGGEVVLALEKRGERVLVSVTDTGRGISKESLPFVFERHYQADSTEARKAAGSGLGLNIVKKILDLHQAAIGVQSELTKGTRIHFELAS